MSKATPARFQGLEVKARPDGSIENLTDAQLFSDYRDLIERGRGDDVFSASLETEDEERLARSVVAFSAYRTASEFMALVP